MIQNLKDLGLGLRRELIAPLKAQAPSLVQFLEIAPENWIGVGGRLGRHFHDLTEIYPFICHGLSLSLGGPKPLNLSLLHQIKKFLDEHHIEFYSEHLSYCGDHGYLYDLLPLPFTAEAVRYVSKRIKRTQEVLERRIAIENVSYYLTPPSSEMSELDFIKAVLRESGCELLLDVNNVYVNSINHNYNAEKFIEGLSQEKICYLHVAGHYSKSKQIKIDTHGADVVSPVWKLLKKTYSVFGALPTVLERDFNIPPLPSLLLELKQIDLAQKKVRTHMRKGA